MLRRLKLSVRFTLLLAVVFVIGIIISWTVLSRAILRHTEQEVTSSGMILIEMLNAVRGYTATHTTPLLSAQSEGQSSFVPEAVPAFAARTVFANFRSAVEYTEFSYKEAALNPRNPLDLADNFEAELLERFRSNPELTDISGFRTDEGERFFYAAHPLTVTGPECLRCHSTPEAAPERLVADYGATNGFGWEPGEIIAAQMIYVPAEEVLSTAQSSFSSIMAILVAIFAILVLVINFLLRRSVIAPVEQLAGLARELGERKIRTVEQLERRIEGLAGTVGRSGELANLMTVFGETAREMLAREQELSQGVVDLVVVIDQAQRARDVDAITQNPRFQELKEKAREMREEQTRV
jgi:HAMP domain-containing protein